MNALVHVPPAQERPGWVGPLFFWEVVRQSRRKGLFVWRMLYAGVLLLVLYLLFGGEVSAKDAALLSESAVQQYLIVQFLAVLILTPIFVAGSLIEDRQNNTLPLLLTTFLTPREIVLGKLAGRLLNVVSVLLAGVPVLALLILLGGVDVYTLLLHTITALVMLAVCGMFAMHAASQCKTVGGAIAKAYLTTIRIAVVLYIWILIFVPSALLLLLVNLWILGYAIQLLRRTVQKISDRAQPQDQLTPALYQSKEPETFDLPAHVVVLHYVPPTLEVNASGEESLPLESARHHVSIRQIRIPPIGEWPILWKDTHFPISYVLYAILAMGSVLLGFLYICLLVPMSASGMKDRFLHGAAPLFMMIPLVITSLQAAGSFADEQQKKTLLSLLSTPFPFVQLIFQKWLACFSRNRHLFTLTSFILLTLLFYYPTRWPLLIILYLSQLACWSLFGVALSMWLQPFPSRAAMAISLFLSVLVAPIVLQRAYATMPICTTAADDTLVDRGPAAQQFLLMLCPHEAWSIILVEDETKKWPADQKMLVQMTQRRGYPFWITTPWIPSKVDKLSQIMTYAYLDTAFLKTCYTHFVLALLLFIFSYLSLLRLRQRAV